MPIARKTKYTKSTLACWSCGLLIATASMPAAFAQNYSFVFTAAPNQPTEFNGTTVEIGVVVEPFANVVDVINWNFIDTALPENVTPSTQITPGTSGLLDNYISDADSLNWIGDFDGASSSFNFYCENGSDGNAMVGDYVEGLPQIPSQYACGTWAPVTEELDPRASVPDAGSSLEMLAAATGGLGAGRLFLRRQRN